MEPHRLIEIALWRLQKYIKPHKEARIVPYIAETLSQPVDLVQERVTNIAKYQKHLEHLLSIPQVQQRSEEWYEMRKNRLTASDTAQALGLSKYGKQQPLVTKKAFPDRFPRASHTSVPSLRHGVVFESMALRCYTQRHGDIDVHEFGMLPHPDISCYGASPDGITALGVMVEIKCPFKRVIDGEVPEHYYLQMQGQMAVCGLTECDYIECDIAEMQSAEEYLATDTGKTTKDHGIVIEKHKHDGQEYIYSPPGLTAEQCIEWAKTLDNQYRTSYWVLKQIHIKRIQFDEAKWQTYIPTILDFWKQVEDARIAQPTPHKKYSFIADSDDDT